jgi:hypothetical protein
MDMEPRFRRGSFLPSIIRCRPLSSARSPFFLLTLSLLDPPPVAALVRPPPDLLRPRRPASLPGCAKVREILPDLVAIVVWTRRRCPTRILIDGVATTRLT